MRQADWLAETTTYGHTVINPAASRPLARKTDPATSVQAAERAEAFVASHEARCFGPICDAGGYGATYLEIAIKAGLEPVAVGRRLGAMGKRGVIKRNGQQRGGCMVWVKA